MSTIRSPDADFPSFTADINDTNVVRVPDLEDHVRSLILSHGIPKGFDSALENGHSKEEHSKLAGVPPHLRSASLEEQKEYLAKYPSQPVAPHSPPQPPSTNGKDQEEPPPLPSNAPPKRGRKKLTQAERKNGASNHLQLTPSKPVVEQNLKVKATSNPSRSQAQQRNGALPASQPIPIPVVAQPQPTPSSLVAQSEHPAAITVGSAVPALPSGVNAQSKPRQAPSRLTSGEGRQFHSYQRNFTPSLRTDHQSRVDPGHTYRQRATFLPKQTYPRGYLTQDQSQYESRYTQQQSNGRQVYFSRPAVPPNRQLFNPDQQPKEQLYDTASQLGIAQPLHVQTGYLERLVSIEVPKAEMPREELEVKEALRLVLNNLCRRIVSAHEIEKNTSFDPATVALKCFGSLSSGYATRGSDMDLVLVSPTSMPDTASPESEIPRLLEKEFLDLGYGARLLTRTRVPIIRFCEKPTPDLLQALKDNRAKWEQISDAPPPPPPPEKPKKKSKRRAKKTAISKDSVQTKENDQVKDNIQAMENGQLKDNVQAEESGLDREEAPLPTTISSSPRNDQLRETQPLTTVVDKKDHQTDGQSGQESGTEEDMSELSEHTAEKYIDGVKRTDPLDETALTEELRKKESNTRSVRPPPERTDEELVRLYLLAMREQWFNNEERKIIYRFLNAVNAVKKPNLGNPLELLEARAALAALPDVLSRYRERPQDTHLDFPKDGVGVQCDINFSNFLALHNTSLLRCYSHCDPRIRPLVLFVKAWAKKRKINSPYHGTLSSYGYVLMVLHYVINIATPPLAPNLQVAWKNPPNESPANLECNGCDVRFWRSEKEIRLAADRGTITGPRQTLGHNRQSLGALLRGFFQYYAQESRDFVSLGFSWSQHVISLRTLGGILTKQEKGWTAAKREIVKSTVPDENGREITHRYLLAIEDPFELNHNVARPVFHHGIVAIRNEFRRAYQLIRAAGFDKRGLAVDFFEEGREHVQERTFFGPNPARFNHDRRFGPHNPAKVTEGKDKEANDSGGNGVGAASKPNGLPKTPREMAKGAGVLYDAGAGDVVRDGDVDVQLGRTKTPDVTEDLEDDHTSSPISLNEDIRG
ncbi:hypothetical protein MMC13_005886 [Lambiella insularis]|nr:hypothetical protein [Lambiella insularis]